MSDANTILGSLRSYLIVVPQIQTLLGTGYASRIRAEYVPMQTATNAVKPHIVYQRIATSNIRTLRGTTFTLHDSTVQIDVWAKSAQERDNLADAVRLAMRPNRFHGVWSGLEIRDVSLDLDSDSSSFPDDGTEELDWRTMFRFTIWHRNMTEV